MPVINRTQQAKRLLKAKIEAGMATIALTSAEIYQANLTRKTHPNYPTGPFFDRDNSRPGEYPARRTGQASENVVWGFDASTRISRFGVLGEQHGSGPKPPNKHAGGSHVIWLIRRGRLGPAEVVRDNAFELRREFMQAAKAVR